MRDPSFELERRRPVWAALSEFFLDSELQPDDHRRIAHILSASGYSTTELEQILRREVGPVLLPNLMAVAGEWGSFDLAWLESEIIRTEKFSWFERMLAAVSVSAVRHDWERVLTHLAQERTT